MKYYDEKQNTWIDIRDTDEYKQRKNVLRDIWIVLLLAMLFMPLGAQIGITLVAALISLFYLDEVPYAHQRKEETD